MEATRVTADEVKERMERGEQFAFVDARNPEAWGEAKTNCPGQFEYLPTKWSNTSLKFHAIVQQ